MNREYVMQTLEKFFFCGMLLSLVLVLGGAGCTATGPAVDPQAVVDAAIANPARTDADRERDQRDRPAEILPLLGLQPGDAVVDLFAGGGYYSELLAGIVGPQGRVVLQNNAGYAKWVQSTLQERYIDNTVPPIEVLFSEVSDLCLAAEAFDAALMVMSYHDLYYYNPERGWDRTDVPAYFAQVRQALKPGGRLLIIDHAAQAGTGNTSVQELHRIDPGFARADIESNGFRFIDSSNALRKPDDPLTQNVFAKDIRGATDRFVMLFEKN